MKNVKAYVDYNDETKTHYYLYFGILEEKPKIGERYNHDEIVNIETISIDCENSDDLFNYDYYKLTLKDDENETYNDYVCVRYNNEY